MRRLTACLAVLLLSALPAASQTVLTLGVYLWTSTEADPARAQYMSVADGVADIETDGPEGVKSDSRPVGTEELALMQAAIRDRIAALSLDDAPAVPVPFVTVEWHFTNENSYGEGLATYPVDGVPAAVLAFQKAVFGDVYTRP